MVPGQKNPSGGLHSVQLVSSSGGAPIASLSSRNSLRLQFDEFGNEIHNFLIKAYHFNDKWERSALLPINYMGEMMQDVLFEGTLSRTDRPAFVSYSYSFPNRNFHFKVSGAYLLEVIDQRNGDILFTLPFWISENLGEAITYFEDFPNSVRYPRIMQQLFVEYTHPKEVQVPQVDLRAEFYQNRFWGKKSPDLRVDVSEAGKIRWHNDRNNAFPGVFEIKSLSMPRIENTNDQIFGFDMAPLMPKVVLQRDIMYTMGRNTAGPSLLDGSPSRSDEARYAEVTFRLDPGQNFDFNQKVYVIGSFNNWSLLPTMRMNYDPTNKWFHVNSIMKEGSHSYKYVTYNGYDIDATNLDDAFSNSSLEYHVFVYYRDIATNYIRLLNVFSVVNRAS